MRSVLLGGNSGSSVLQMTMGRPDRAMTVMLVSLVLLEGRGVSHLESMH